MATPEDQIKLAAFLLEHGKEDASKKVLESLANTSPGREPAPSPEESAKEASGKPYLYLDPDIGVRMHNWHSSMSDPVYAVGSQIYAGKKVMKKNLQDAIDNLESFYEMDKKHKHLKPQDRHELEGLIDDLNGYMSGAIEDYSYAFEG